MGGELQFTYRQASEEQACHVAGNTDGGAWHSFMQGVETSLEGWNIIFGRIANFLCLQKTDSEQGKSLSPSCLILEGVGHTDAFNAVSQHDSFVNTLSFQF